jgi:hypothetical protein
VLWPCNRPRNLADVTAVNRYSVDHPGKKEELSDKEEEVEQIEDAEALRIVKRLKL